MRKNVLHKRDYYWDLKQTKCCKFKAVITGVPLLASPPPLKAAQVAVCTFQLNVPLNTGNGLPGAEKTISEVIHLPTAMSLHSPIPALLKTALLQEAWTCKKCLHSLAVRFCKIHLVGGC